MRRSVSSLRTGWCTTVLFLLLVRSASAADAIYFPAVQDVASILVNRINAETVRIDMSAWYLSEHAISIALVNRFKAGVPVRLIGDRVGIFENDRFTKREFYWIASQGVPIRLRYEPTFRPEIDHWKATIFAGQRLVSFGSANYTPVELAPVSPTNYKDETVMFSDDPAIVNGFRTKFDRMWNDTLPEPGSVHPQPPYLKNWNDACALEAQCADYRTQYPSPAPMAINTARLEPDYPLPPDLIWGQGPEFNERLVTEINRETVRVDLVAYRLTAASVADALLNRYRQGVFTRIIIEPEQYTSRDWPEFWLTHAYIDRLWAAGVQIKKRAHDGLTHMKLLVTSQYATNASSNIAESWQRDHDYFVSATTKPAIYQAMRQRFDAMWLDPNHFVPFVPQPPDAPDISSPAHLSTGVGVNALLIWNRAAFATSYDVYLGTSPNGLAPVANVPAELVAEPPRTYLWNPGGLRPGTTYYWQVVSRTFADRTAAGPVRSFTTLRGNDLAVFRPSTGEWWVRSLSPIDTRAYDLEWGTAGDVPVKGDFDGDGKLDLAVFRPSTGIWWIRYSSTGYAASLSVQWGAAGDVPMPADFDGDARTDLVVFRPSSGDWFVLTSSSGYTRSFSVNWGTAGDIPVRGDFDRDGKPDLVVFRPSTGVWWIRYSSTAYTTWSSMQWGTQGDVPVAGDYDGDRRTDLAVFRPSSGDWFVRTSSSNYASAFSIQWGTVGDIPIRGDFDGDGRADIVVFRPSSGLWWIRYSTSNYMQSISMPWGAPGDIPVAGDFH
jgi:hypothetical protein